jgi:hypothetical protein
MSQREYPFYYANGFLYLGLMGALMLGWFFLVGLAELLCYRFGFRWPAFVTPVVIFAGLVAIWWLLRFRLGRLYTRRGVGVIREDGFELRLHRKNISICFADLLHLTYQPKRGKGLIITAKGNSLYLEPPYTPVQGDDNTLDGVKNFYLELKVAYEKSRQNRAESEEALSEETQEPQP